MSDSQTYALPITRQEAELLQKLLIEAPIQGSLQTLPLTLSLMSNLVQRIQDLLKEQNPTHADY